MSNDYDLYLEYFVWLAAWVNDREHNSSDYTEVLWKLYDTKFIVSMEKDQNRVDDALDFRTRFVPFRLDFHVSILEIMISMAARIEDTIMKNTSEEDRTSVWFWDMMNSLGLANQTDILYDEQYVLEVLHDFNNRKYERNGVGSLFVTRDKSKDMRKMELWFQMHEYLKTVLQQEGYLRKEN